MPKMVNFCNFWKPEAYGQTVLPDRSILIGQKLVENAKMLKFKYDILDEFRLEKSHFEDFLEFVKSWKERSNMVEVIN